MKNLILFFALIASVVAINITLDKEWQEYKSLHKKFYETQALEVKR